jgi:hypothetical protein
MWMEVNWFGNLPFRTEPQRPSDHLVETRNRPGTPETDSRVGASHFLRKLLSNADTVALRKEVTLGRRRRAKLLRLSTAAPQHSGLLFVRSFDLYDLAADEPGQHRDNEPGHRGGGESADDVALDQQPEHGGKCQHSKRAERRASSVQRGSLLPAPLA